MNLWTSAVLGAAILAVASAQFTSGMGPAMGPAPASARPLSPAQGRPTTLAPAPAMPPAPAMAPAPAAEPGADPAPAPAPGADPAPAPAMPRAPESCVPPPPPPPASCACGAAQPISIQLSCGGGGNRRPGGPRPRPPPPPQEVTTWAPMWTSTTAGYYDGGWWGQETTPGSPFDGYDMNNFCTFDVNGYPDPAYTPPGGFPSGFRLTHNSDGSPQIEVGPGEQRPPPHWDGSPATLGFPMPPMGTPTGNMLMCWPIPVATGRK